jgi:hypothetical protein
LDRRLGGPQSRSGRGGEETTVDVMSLNKLRELHLEILPYYANQTSYIKGKGKDVSVLD